MRRFFARGAAGYRAGAAASETVRSPMRAPHRHPVAGSSRAPRPRVAGVSLVVVLVSLVLVGAIAVIAIPAYFNRHDVTLDSACRLLSRDIRSLQNRAALEKHEVRLEFGPDGWRALDTSGAPVAGVGETVPIVRRFAGEGVFVGVVVESYELGPDKLLGIDARGLVTEHAEIVLSFRGEHRRLKIHRGSGEIAVESLAR
jgi:hypothetical protein